VYPPGTGPKPDWWAVGSGNRSPSGRSSSSRTPRANAAASALEFTDPLVETVSGYEISIQAAGHRRGCIIVNGLTAAEDAQEVFEALKRGSWPRA